MEFSIGCCHLLNQIISINPYEKAVQFCAAFVYEWYYDSGYAKQYKESNKSELTCFERYFW